MKLYLVSKYNIKYIHYTGYVLCVIVFKEYIGK